jgi:hydroxymethylbilane synthase
VSTPTLRIGTRRSALARAQADWVREKLQAHFADMNVALVPMQTSGDKLLDAPLAKFGGKGLFVKELEEGLLGRRIDLAVHSLKDVPAELPRGLHLGAICEREDPRDVLVAPAHRQLDRLPEGARLGTGSLRRRAQLMARRPDLEIVPLRGNVATRLEKIDRQGLDGVILALAGLRRLGLEERVTEVIDPAILLPAIGQGSLAIECRADDPETNARVAVLTHGESRIRAESERAFLARLGGGCQVPIGACATLEGERLTLRAFLGTPDGKRVLRGERAAPAPEAETLGRGLAEEFIGRGAEAILAEMEAAFESGGGGF